MKRSVKRMGYNKEDILAAIADVREKKLSINKAALSNKVPRSTLKKKLNGEPITLKSGPAPYLSSEVENELARKVVHRTRCGYPLDRKEVAEAAKDIALSLDLDSLPTKVIFGRKWFFLFLKRHPEIKMKLGKAMTNKNVLEEDIRLYVAELRQYLLEYNNNDEALLLEMLASPTRFITLEESDYKFVDYKARQLHGEKGEALKSNTTKSTDKIRQTVLMGFDAAGNLCPPIILYNFKRLPQSIRSNCPAGWHAVSTDSGWMKSPALLESIKIVVQWAKKRNVKFPIVIFVNNNANHISFRVSDYCLQHKVILYCLYPNCIAFQQPSVPLVARVMKEWSAYIGKNNRDLQTCIPQVNQYNFASHFKEVLDSMDGLPELCSEAFRAGGLYPFNPDSAEDQHFIIDHTSEANQACLSADSPRYSSETVLTISVKEVVSEMLQVLNIEDQESFVTSIKENKYCGSREHLSLFLAWKSQVQKLIDADMDWVPAEQMNTAGREPNIEPPMAASFLELSYTTDSVEDLRFEIQTASNVQRDESIDERLSSMKNQMEKLLSDFDYISQFVVACNKVPMLHASSSEMAEAVTPSTPLPTSTLVNVPPKRESGVSRVSATQGGNKQAVVPSTSCMDNSLDAVPTTSFMYSRLDGVEPGEIVADRVGTISPNRKKRPIYAVADHAGKEEHTELFVKKKKQTLREKENREEDNLEDEEDWVCKVCQSSYISEVKQNKRNKWVECDKCLSPYHIKCIDENHPQLILLKKTGDNETINFECSVCL